jgi:hypothetical protein
VKKITLDSNEELIWQLPRLKIFQIKRIFQGTVLIFDDFLLLFHQLILLISYIYPCRDGTDSWKTKLNLPPKDRRVKTTVSFILIG